MELLSLFFLNQRSSSYWQDYDVIFHNCKGFQSGGSDKIINLRQRIFEWFTCHQNLRQTVREEKKSF